MIRGWRWRGDSPPAIAPKSVRREPHQTFSGDPGKVLAAEGRYWESSSERKADDKRQKALLGRTPSHVFRCRGLTETSCSTTPSLSFSHRLLSGLYLARALAAR